MSRNDTAAVQRKQACANRLQAVGEEKIILVRQIQQLNYQLTADMRRRMDVLIDDYTAARAAYMASAEDCNVEVYVTPIQRPL